MANHWFYERCCKTGGNLNPHPEKQRKGPLRKIVGLSEEHYTADRGFFDRPVVILECGHKVQSDGQHKARCPYCATSEVDKLEKKE